MNAAIKLKEKIGYGLGDAASSMFWKIFSMYLMFFYTDVFGISAAAVGTMFLITRIWDAFFDPVVGVIADRTETRWGKFRPYLLWIAIPFGLIGIVTFYVPDLSSSADKLIYAYITYSLMMMVYSTINVPYASLLGVMSADGKERTTLSSYRMVFAFIGSLITLWLIEPLVKNFGNGTMTSADGWLKAVSVFAVVAALLFLGCFALTRERVKPINESSNSLKSDFKDLWKNKPWWILLFAGVFSLMFNAVRDGATVYYFKYFINNNNEVGFFNTSLSLTTLYLVLGQAANIIGVVLATPVANRFGKKNTFFAAMLIAAGLSVIFYFFKEADIVLIMVFQCLISICAGSIFPLIWSMYADTADYSEHKEGRRATGLIFSASSLSQKLGWTIGGAGTGWLLAYFGFQANEAQSDTTQAGIKLMLSLLPALAAALSAFFIFLYPLSEKKLEHIKSELDKKRTSEKLS